MGKGYIVGAGPGDIGLISIKGLELIKKANVILYDRLIDKNLLAFANKNCKLIYVGKSSSTGGETQKWINEVFAEETKKNEIVLRLHGGDPLLFGRGSEEIDELIENKLEYEVIPGISSSFAVATYGGIPVTKRGLSSSLHIFTARSNGGDLGLDFSLMAKIKGTITILMGIGVINEIAEGLIKEGMSKETPVSVIQEGTTIKQKAILGNLGNISDLVEENKIKAPGIILIGGTASLLGKYDWFTKKELFGKRIVFTRDKDSFLRSSKVFEDTGAKTIPFPMIELKTDFSVLTKEFYKDVENFDFISFNSPKAVNSFFEGLEALNLDSRILKNTQIIVMGSGTKEELSKYFLRADFIPKEYSVNSLLVEIRETFGEDKKILLLSSDIHGRNQEELSKLHNLEIKIKSIYKNFSIEYTKEEVLENLKENDYLIFLSASAVESFKKNTENIDISKYKFVSIGPMTSKALIKNNFPVDFEAETYNLEGIRKAIRN